jgi:hypothetical protein
MMDDYLYNTVSMYAEHTKVDSMRHRPLLRQIGQRGELASRVLHTVAPGKGDHASMFTCLTTLNNYNTLIYL